MIGEDVSAFFDTADFAVECSHNGHTFPALFNRPQELASFEATDMLVGALTITAPTADVAAAGIVSNGQVMVDGTLYRVRFVQLGGDAALSRVELGSAIP